MSDIPKIDGRDIYEVANQLGGYVGPDTEDGLAKFLLRESNEATKLADEICRLRAALSAAEVGRDEARKLAIEEAAKIASAATDYEDGRDIAADIRSLGEGGT